MKPWYYLVQFTWGDFFDKEKQGIRDGDTQTELDEKKCGIIRQAAEEVFAEIGDRK